MELVKARPEQIGALTAISKAAFDSDVDVGADSPDGPPEYDSEPWHIEMMNRGQSVCCDGAKRGHRRCAALPGCIRA